MNIKLKVILKQFDSNTNNIINVKNMRFTDTSICSLNTKRTPKLNKNYHLEWIKFENNFFTEGHFTLRKDMIKPRYFTIYVWIKSEENPECIQMHEKIFDTTKNKLKNIKFNKEKNQLIIESSTILVSYLGSNEEWENKIYKGFITIQLNQKGWKKLLRYIKNLLSFNFNT